MSFCVSLLRENKLDVVMLAFEVEDELIIGLFGRVGVEVLFVDVGGGVVIKVFGCIVGVVLFSGSVGFVPAAILLVGCWPLVIGTVGLVSLLDVIPVLSIGLLTVSVSCELPEVSRPA
jgi:hypothetical protein